MKKIVKPIAIAAAAAAVVGVGAVSFAKWTAVNTSTSDSLTTGTVDFLEFDATTPATPVEDLLPYDQTDPDTDLKYGTATLKFNAPEAGSVYITVEASGSYTLAGTLLVDEEAPTKTAIEGNSYGAALANGGSVELTYTATAGENTVTVYYVLNSNNVADMEQEITLTYTLSDTSANA